MSMLVANSIDSLQAAFGVLRDEWNSHKFLEIDFRAGVDRSLDQNSISHVWYAQISRQLREDDSLGWKCFCKLHFGVPILRTEDTDFRAFYDGAIKGLSYEQKLEAMKFIPVTSDMTKVQLSKYLEAMQKHFAERGVFLEFPVPRAA